MENNTLLGTVYTKTFTLNIEILKLDKEVPTDKVDDFIDWFKNKAIEVGTGRQKEFYGYTEHPRDDIGVLFRVFCA